MAMDSFALRSAQDVAESGQGVNKGHRLTRLESQTLTLLVHARYIDDHNAFGAYSASTVLMGLAVLTLILMTTLQRRRA